MKIIMGILEVVFNNVPTSIKSTYLVDNVYVLDC